MKKMYKFIFVSIIVIFFSAACGGGGNVVPTSEPENPEVTSLQQPIVILVVDNFTQTSQAQPDSGTCTVAPDGQGLYGGRESALTILGEPHGVFVYKDLEYQIEASKDFTRIASEGVDFKSATTFSNSHPWIVRYDLYQYKVSDRSILTMAIDTNELNVKSITENIPAAIKLAMGGMSLSGYDTSPATKVVVNMSFVLVPCDPMKYIYSPLRSFTEKNSVYLTDEELSDLKVLKSRYDARGDFYGLVNSLENIRDLKDKFANLYKTGDDIDDAIFQSFIVSMVYSPGSDRSWEKDDAFYDKLSGYSSDVVYVGASGNFETQYPFAPASWNFVDSISSQASDYHEQINLPEINLPDRRLLAKYSNWGEIQMDGDFVGDPNNVFGTSFAAPKFSYRIARYLLDGGSSPCADNPSIQPVLGFGMDDYKQYPVQDIFGEQLDNLTFDFAMDRYCPSPVSDKVQIRWFVGLGTGTNPEQVAIQEEVVSDFNASQDKIELVLEIVPFDSARDTLSTQIASGAGPDIVGPVGWGGSNDFYGQWLDISPYIQSSGFDTSVFDPALVKFYQTEEGQVGLPFAVFPGAIYFRPDMFNEAGLNYPPQVYGAKYQFPDGREADWNWATVTEVARLLTVDANGYNSTQFGFDRNQIVQVGYAPQWQSVLSIGTFYGGAQKIYSGDTKGYYQSTIPESWKEAWKWYYDGMYGEQPFIATGPLAGAPEFGNGNIFNAGKAAMGLTQTWYTCCLGDFKNAGLEFQLGIQPIGANGVVSGRVDADTFRILKGSAHPAEAFEVLAYLITTGGDKLLPVYGAMPAIASKTDAFFAKKSQDYPFVTTESWNVFVQGLAYPDAPSSEQYQPNSIKATARFATFFDLMNNTEGLDFDAEFQKLVDDLNVIYNE